MGAPGSVHAAGSPFLMSAIVQDAGSDRARSPAAEGRPEQRSVLGRAKALRRAAATRLEILPAP